MSICFICKIMSLGCRWQGFFFWKWNEIVFVNVWHIFIPTSSMWMSLLEPGSPVWETDSRWEGAKSQGHSIKSSSVWRSQEEIMYWCFLINSIKLWPLNMPLTVLVASALFVLLLCYQKNLRWNCVQDPEAASRTGGGVQTAPVVIRPVLKRSLWPRNSLSDCPEASQDLREPCCFCVSLPVPRKVIWPPPARKPSFSTHLRAMTHPCPLTALSEGRKSVEMGWFWWLKQAPSRFLCDTTISSRKPQS